MFLVAGGLDLSDYPIIDSLSSTEVLSTTSSAWVVANPLPRTLYGMKGVTLGGVLYITGIAYVWKVYADIWLSGGSDGNGARDEVYSWTGESWVEVGKMKMSRYYHAVSSIGMDDSAMKFCI